MDPSTDLLATLNRTIAADAIRMPAYPAIATRLQRMVREERFGLHEVSSVIAADAALAAVVLRQASSAGIAIANANVTLTAAVFRLGVDAVIRLALASTIGVAAGAAGPLAPLRRDRWRCSLLSGLLAQDLAGRSGVAPEQAFLAGLLHDFGSIVVIGTVESLAGPNGLPVLSPRAWNDMVERFHVSVGSSVARRWQLPEPIANAIAFHHDPGQTPAPDRALVELVALTDAVISTLDAAPSRGVAALDQVRGLAPETRRRIAALMPTLAHHMASFEAVAPVGGPPGPGKTAIEVDHDRDGFAPVSFAVDARGTTTPYRASAISDDAIEIVGKGALKPGMLATLTLKCGRTPITILATIKQCTPCPDGYRIVAQPFGLATEDRAIWAHVASTARADAEPVVVCG